MTKASTKTGEEKRKTKTPPAVPPGNSTTKSATVKLINIRNLLIDN